MKAARASTREQDAFVNAVGEIDHQTIVVGVQNFAFMGGSMGQAVGAAFIAGARAAIERSTPYVVFTAAGGADRKSVVEGKSVSVRLDLGGRRLMKKKKKK